MENKQVFSSETQRIMKKIFWILFTVTAIIWLADLVTGIEYSITWNAKIWYFTGVLIYIIAGGGITFEANDENIKGPVRHWLDGLLCINIAFIAVSIIGLIINFFFSVFHWFGFFSLLPLSVQAVLGWPSIVATIVLILLTIGFSVIKEDILPTEDYE